MTMDGKERLCLQTAQERKLDFHRSPLARLLLNRWWQACIRIEPFPRSGDRIRARNLKNFLLSVHTVSNSHADQE